jgi:hypothetical protein
MTERRSSHLMRVTRGREAPLLAHRPLAAELGVSSARVLTLHQGNCFEQ